MGVAVFFAARTAKKSIYQIGSSSAVQLWMVGICHPSLNTLWTIESWPSIRFQTTSLPM